MPAMISLPSLRGNVKHGTPERIINQLCGQRSPQMIMT
jgi:hypothetical protein